VKKSVSLNKVFSLKRETPDILQNCLIFNVVSDYFTKIKSKIKNKRKLHTNIQSRLFDLNITVKVGL